MSSRTNARVVITGLGPVSACGTGKGDYWAALIAGRSGIGPITSFDTTDFAAKVAGEVRDFDLSRYFQPKTPLRRLSRQTQLALAATRLAFDDAEANGRLPFGDRRVPVCLGVSTSAYTVVEEAASRLIQKGPHRISAYSSAASQPHQAASIIALEFNLLGSAHTYSSACPSGLDAITAATDMIRTKKADMAVAGGCDAPVCKLGIACLQQSGLVSRVQPGMPIGGPFSKGNDSGIIAEGAGIVILESMQSARNRDATIYAEIVGWASHVDPDSNDLSAGLYMTIAHALENAGLLPEDIDYICAHGSGHPALDRIEIGVIKKLFGAHAYRVPISSIKGAIGNPLAAAGPLQLISSALALQSGQIPPTANLRNQDQLCDLDIVSGIARKQTANYILINSHGLGGGNTAMIIHRDNDI